MSAGNITQFLNQLATFTVTSANATLGAVYTSGGFSFTVQQTIAAKTTLLATASGSPAASGTLTKVSGTGDATITFSAVAISNAYSDPLNTSGFEGQSNYNEYAQIGIAGMPFDIAENRDMVSPVAYETIGLGRGVVRMPSYNVAGQFVARLPRANVAKMVISGALSGADTVNLKVNGIAMAQVTAGGTPATDAAAIVAALKAMAPVYTAAIDTTDTNNLTFLVYSQDGTDCLITNFAVVGHSITATITVTTNDIVLGVSMQTQGMEQQLGSLILQYPAMAAMSTMRAGRIWVFAEQPVNPNDPVYVRLQDGTTVNGGSISYTVLRGGFRKDSDSSTAVLVPNWFWWQGCTDLNNGLAVIQTK